MKTAVFAIYAVYASQAGYPVAPDASNYNRWIERITAASTGERPAMHHDTVRFAEWSKHYRGK